MKETVEHNNRFYEQPNGEMLTENEQLKEWLIVANEETERLNNIINNTAAELEILLQSEDFELITMQLKNIVFRLKGSDKK